ncbi:MAG: CTP synthase [bacterium]|nr:CTP synthase [bacterium]
MAKFLFVAGGVMSGVGKGVATASIGAILKSKGFSVSAIKIDPYLNMDAGTMNPVEHGEVFVTDDGTECDQDIGNYERFLDRNLSTINYLTSGRVYHAVIEKERKLEYNGETVEVGVHIPEEIIARIKQVATHDKADFVLVEIGGTVGDYQNVLFLEASRLMKLASPNDVLFVLVTYLPVPRMLGEMKTKPTQHAVRALNATGIRPDFIVARSEALVDGPRKRKISVFCNVAPEDVISSPDVSSVYDIPIQFEEDQLGNRILKKFRMKERAKDLKEWRKLSLKAKGKAPEIYVGVVGKYITSGDFMLSDSYISVVEAIKHASWAKNRTPRILWFSAEEYEKKGALKILQKDLKQCDCVIVPGGFGERGTEGKILAIQHCRENNIPYLGLCFGLQLAIIEFARNVCGMTRATSREFSKTGDLVIDVMEDQKRLLETKKYGASMRLGAYRCDLAKGSLAWRLYGKKDAIQERHRHRYEFNNAYKEALEAKGAVFSGTNKERDLVEIMEIPSRSFFLGAQFHPELTSRPLRPHPLFVGLLEAAIKRKKSPKR